jgi:glycosyltransferase involved in cell wall biosynthesis
MTISLIATVLNEGESIRRLMDSILRQTRQPDEIVIVDGGSTDNTVAILQSYVDQLPLHVYVHSDCNISEGRNAAIEAAQGDIIAVTDAGVGLPDNWLECLTEPLLNEPNVQVVSGFFRAAPQNVFEAAMGATVLPLRDEIKPETFLPSSRSVAFRKSAWEAVDGYPEWLDYCEDLVFDLRLKERYGSFAFAPDAVVDFRPRGSLEALFKQYYLYARGDGKADLWRKRHAIRYATYLGVIPAILFLALYVHPLLILLYLPGAAVYLYQPYRRLPTVLKTLPNVTSRDWLRAIGLVPVIRVVGDIAKMMGYPEGVRWRREVLPPDWREIPEQTPKSV